MSESQNDGPWKWHIEETFKGLIQIALELLKTLVLINGGAAVALLAYLGTLAAHDAKSGYPPSIKCALLCFASGVLAATSAFMIAYLTQLRLYQEERERHMGKPFRSLHSIGITIGTILILASASAFGAGCWIAATAFQKVQ
jgi:hypothetical protein